MGAKLNGTYLTLGGHVEVSKYRYLYFVVMFTVYILIICSNSTIISLIWIHRDLHEPMYIFIAALSLNSVFFSTSIYPKLLIDFLSERQIISYSACVIQEFMYYSFGASDFLLLAAMAYDRYVSICKPLQYPTIMRKKTVTIFICLAWFLPSGQGVVAAAMRGTQKLCNFTLEGIFCNNLLNKLQCVRSRSLFLYSLVVWINVIILPVLFILFTYTQIFIIAHRSCKEVRKKAAETCLPHLLVLIGFFSFSAFDVIFVEIESDMRKITRLIMTLQIILYHPLFNPVIYGLKMKEISKHLKRLFCQHKLK